MQNKNSKSESYIVREAENIIEKYLESRELSDINKYYKLRERYRRLKIVTSVTLFTLFVTTLLSIFI